jgi:hypothetical protein
MANRTCSLKIEQDASGLDRTKVLNTIQDHLTFPVYRVNLKTVLVGHMSAGINNSTTESLILAQNERWRRASYMQAVRSRTFARGCGIVAHG